MKLTLEELNDHIWHRALRVAYVLSYLAFLAIGSVFVVDGGRYHVPSHIPASAPEAFHDENFYLLSSVDMISALSVIDADFKNLPENEKQKAVIDIKQNKSKYSKGKANYVYVAQTGMSLAKTVTFAVICILATVAVMEFIRRCFYYVVIGQILPRKRQQ